MNHFLTSQFRSHAGEFRFPSGWQPGLLMCHGGCPLQSRDVSITLDLGNCRP